MMHMANIQVTQVLITLAMEHHKLPVVQEGKAHLKLMRMHHLHMDLFGLEVMDMILMEELLPLVVAVVIMVEVMAYTQVLHTLVVAVARRSLADIQASML
jgi:hypothetical protein